MVKMIRSTLYGLTLVFQSYIESVQVSFERYCNMKTEDTKYEESRVKELKDEDSPLHGYRGRVVYDTGAVA